MREFCSKVIFVLALLMALTVNAFAQVLAINQLSINEGLSQSTVTTMLVDSRNRLWAGTCSGLNLLESSNFVHYDAAKKYGNSFLNNNIRSLSETEEGNILVGSENGAFELNNKEIKKIRYEWLKQKDKMVRAYSINGKTLIITREGHFAILSKLGRVLYRDTIENNEGAQTVVAHGDKVAVISRFPNKIVVIDTKKLTKIVYKGYFDNFGETLSTIDFSGNKYLVTSNFGFYTLTNESVIFKSWESIGINYDVTDLAIRFFSTDKFGNIWLGIYSRGIFVFDKDFKLIHEIGGNFINSNGVHFNLFNPTCIAFDQSANTFIGTDGAGVIKVNLLLKKFTHILPTDISNGKLSENFTTSTFMEDGKLYFGVLNSALTIYDFSSKESFLYTQKNNNNQYINKIYFINRLNSKNLLVGTDAGLFTFDNKNGLHYLNIKNSGIQFKNSSKLDDGGFLLGAQSGVYIYYNNEIRLIKTNQIDQISLIFRLKNKEYLIAEKGLGLFKLKFTTTDTLITEIKINNLNTNNKPNFTDAIYDGKFYWVCGSDGLMKFDYKLKHLSTLTIANGLPDNQIYNLEIDNNKALWLTSNRGITYYNPSENYIHNFTIQDGIQSNEFNTGASFKANDGTLIFAGVNGINFIDPEKVYFNKVKPTVLLRNIYLFDKELSFNNLINNIPIELSYLDNSLTFDFSVYENTVPEKNDLEIMLVGIDMNWVNLKNKRMMRYPFLPPGKHELWARACNNDGRWSSPILLATINIRPPFWLQTWFIITTLVASLFLISLIFYLIYLKKERQKIAEIKTLQEIEKVRLRISKEIHDDIGSGLTQIAMISEQVQMEVDFDNDNTFVNNKLSKLRSISRELIQSMSEIVWFINPCNDSLENMLIYIRVMLNRIFEDSEIDLRLDFPMKVDKIDLNSETKRKIILMVKEAVNNAIKYSKASKMLVKITYDNNSLLFNIKDDGIGFAESKNILGNGLRNMKQSAEEIGFDYQLQSVPGEGTTIIFGGKLGGR